MRKPLAVLGALTAGTGLALYLMLGQLRSAFFRAYLPPWMYASYAVIGLGTIALVLGVVSKASNPSVVAAKSAAMLTARLSLVNAAVAAGLLAPVLYPGFRFPILITQWPGIYMVLAYFSFLTVGVLGMAAWSLLFLNLPQLIGGEGVGRAGFTTQVVMTQVGIYGLTVFMFLGGYVGAWLAYTGAGPTAVGAQMEFSVIPSAVSIFGVAAGTVVGIANLFLTGRSIRV